MKLNHRSLKRSCQSSKINFYPTNMCINSAPYLHQKSANWASNIIFSMLWCWCCSLNLSASRRCSSSIIFFYKCMVNLHQIWNKEQISPKLHQKGAFWHLFKNLVHIRCWHWNAQLFSWEIIIQKCKINNYPKIQCLNQNGIKNIKLVYFSSVIS